MRIMPETGFGQARAAAMVSSALLGVSIYALDRLNPSPLIHPAEHNAQVEACSRNLPRLGHLATQEQIDATPCKQFLGGFGHDEIVTTYYEAGSSSTDNTGTQVSDVIKYVLPKAQSFQKSNFINPAHAMSSAEQTKHQTRQGLADALSIGGGLALIELMTIGTLEVMDGRNKKSRQAAVLR